MWWGRGHADPNATTVTYHGGPASTDRDARAYQHAFADRYTYPRAYFYRHSSTDGNTDGFCYSDAKRNTHRHSHSDGNRDAYAHSHPGATVADTHAYPHGHSYAAPPGPVK